LASSRGANWRSRAGLIRVTDSWSEFQLETVSAGVSMVPPLPPLTFVFMCVDTGRLEALRGGEGGLILLGCSSNIQLAQVCPACMPSCCLRPSCCLLSLPSDMFPPPTHLSTAWRPGIEVWSYANSTAYSLTQSVVTALTNGPPIYPRSPPTPRPPNRSRVQSVMPARGRVG
jgi:hypothetical protein